MINESDSEEDWQVVIAREPRRCEFRGDSVFPFPFVNEPYPHPWLQSNHIPFPSSSKHPEDISQYVDTSGASTSWGSNKALDRMLSKINASISNTKISKVKPSEATTSKSTTKESSTSMVSPSKSSSTVCTSEQSTSATWASETSTSAAGTSQTSASELGNSEPSTSASWSNEPSTSKAGTSEGWSNEPSTSKAWCSEPSTSKAWSSQPSTSRASTSDASTSNTGDQARYFDYQALDEADEIRVQELLLAEAKKNLKKQQKSKKRETKLDISYENFGILPTAVKRKRSPIKYFEADNGDGHLKLKKKKSYSNRYGVSPPPRPLDDIEYWKAQQLQYFVARNRVFPVNLNASSDKASKENNTLTLPGGSNSERPGPSGVMRPPQNVIPISGSPRINSEARKKELDNSVAYMNYRSENAESPLSGGFSSDPASSKTESIGSPKNLDDFTESSMYDIISKKSPENADGITEALDLSMIGNANKYEKVMFQELFGYNSESEEDFPNTEKIENGEKMKEGNGKVADKKDQEMKEREKKDEETTEVDKKDEGMKEGDKKGEEMTEGDKNGEEMKEGDKNDEEMMDEGKEDKEMKKGDKNDEEKMDEGKKDEGKMEDDKKDKENIEEDKKDKEKMEEDKKDEEKMEDDKKDEEKIEEDKKDEEKMEEDNRGVEIDRCIVKTPDIKFIMGYGFAE